MMMERFVVLSGPHTGAPEVVALGLVVRASQPCGADREACHCCWRAIERTGDASDRHLMLLVEFSA